MSSNFDYPFQSGTESLPTEPNQRLGGVRPSGNEVNDEHYEEVVQRNSALIDMFTRQSRQEANLSGLDSYYNSEQYPEFDISYIRQFGKEHVNVSPKPKRPEEDKKKPEPEIIEDIMLDGYIGVIYNANNIIGHPEVVETDHAIGFNKVWVYIPDYEPPGGYPPNGDFLVAVPSYDGVTYGIMDFNVWYPLAKKEWVVYDPNGFLGLKWVGPDNERYVHNLDNYNFPLVTSPFTGLSYTIQINISTDTDLHYYYKLTTGFEQVPAIGPEFHNKVPIQISLNSTTILEYTAEKTETKCFIFRFGKNACRSHSYRDQITEDFGLELLNPIIPSRADPNDVFKELLPANCGLDPNFWHGAFQVYDNYTGQGIVPVEIVDMGIFSRDLIIEGLNRVTASFGNPPQTTTYFSPGIDSSNTDDTFFESIDPVGQISMFAEFFSRNPEDFRLVDQSWRNPYKDGTQYRVNDLPKYFFPNANKYPLPVTNAKITAFVDFEMNPTSLETGIHLTSQPDILDDIRYLFSQKVPFSRNIAATTVQNPKFTASNYSDFSFEFDLSSDALTKIPATQNLPDGYNQTSEGTSARVDMIRQPYPIWIQNIVRRFGNFLPSPIAPGDLGGFSLFGEMFLNVWRNPASSSFEMPVTNYWYEPEVENGVSDWLLFVRSLMPPYIINGDDSITKPQEEEKFLKE